MIYIQKVYKLEFDKNDVIDEYHLDLLILLDFLCHVVLYTNCQLFHQILIKYNHIVNMFNLKC
jgi:hypothetical protein